MTFPTKLLNDPQVIGAGERHGTTLAVLTSVLFENLLNIGRFAQLVAGSINNMAGNPAPVIAGVVLRNVASPVESGGVVDNTIFSQVEYMRAGLVTVDVKPGETPAQFGPVYASNAVGSEGMATATSTDVATNAEYIEEIKPNVWLIRLK